MICTIVLSRSKRISLELSEIHSCLRLPRLLGREYGKMRVQHIFRRDLHYPLITSRNSREEGVRQSGIAAPV
jgi:hypothetical protein